MENQPEHWYFVPVEFPDDFRVESLENYKFMMRVLDTVARREAERHPERLRIYAVYEIPQC